MLSSNPRMAVRVRRRKTPGWPVWLSLALHLTLFVSLLMIPATQPPTSASEPLAVDFVVGGRDTGAACRADCSSRTGSASRDTSHAGSAG
jgi:hypothetical protein